MIMEPTPPAIAPMPVMVAMVLLGNMSPMVEKRFALQAWCPAAARPIRMAGHQGESNLMPRGWAKRAAIGKNAKISIASIRPA